MYYISGCYWDATICTEIIHQSMPIKAIFPTNLSTKVRIHKGLVKAIRARDGLSITEAINTALAREYAPQLLAEFEEFKKIPMTFPNRITKNRFSRKS